MRNERSLVKELRKILEQKKEQENKPYWLKRVYSHVNLATKDFQGIWSGWWEGETPPKLELDMIFVFEDIKKVNDDALIVATEIKFFRDIAKRNFFEGLQQALAYSLFGFDGLALWHIFSEEVDDKIVKNYAKATNDIIKGFELPIFYLSAKISNQSKFISFAPSQTSEQDLDYFVKWMENSCRDKRNCLLFKNIPLGPNSEEIKKRRNTLKVMLKIPV